MAASMVPALKEKKRVKVYELKNNDWFDRGTGFCTGRYLPDATGGEEARVIVESEDEPERFLLETKIGKDDGYQKQQDTLIVWTEQSGVDMALSFQEAEGCASIWEFVSEVQQRLLALGPDDALSDDAMEAFAANPLVLPQPELGNLEDIERAMRSVITTQQGRDALAKFVISEDYVRKLTPLVETAEDLESLKDLHMLCNIMKMLILLNDSQIIDHIVSETVVFGVVGALEYDPDFPNHKANHRRYLRDQSRYKEVVKIADSAITKKIHATWRLTYLKDVVLARVLDDPTFGILNSLIFFNQVDIIGHLQDMPAYLEELFGIIDSPSSELQRKKDAVGFIQSCCAIAKSLQALPRANLYTIFIKHGLLRVITFAILNEEASLRVAGTDILVAMIDHDPSMVRSYILKSISEKKTPLTDTLIELLLLESDLGVKAQAADAIKVLLEPSQTIPHPAAQAQAQAQGQDPNRNGDYVNLKIRNSNPQMESYVAHFYDTSAIKLFKPLKDLEQRTHMTTFSFNDVQLFSHLVEIIIYLTRTHQQRSRYYLFSENLISRIAQLFSAPQKHLKLTALKFFRSCIGLQDDLYFKHFIQKDLFAPILNIVYETMPKDNLLNSACLEFFDHIKTTGFKSIIEHLATVHTARLRNITYVSLFHDILHRWEQMNQPPPPVDQDMTLFSNDRDRGVTPDRRTNANGARWQGIKEMDSAEQVYFDGSDDEEDELHSASLKNSVPSERTMPNGLAPSPVIKSLVDYPDDDEDIMDAFEDEPFEGLTGHHPASFAEQSRSRRSHSPVLQTPPERISEKRRRENDDDDGDELGKLSSTSKRRTSGSATTSPGNTMSPGGTHTLKRKKNFLVTKDTDNPSISDTSDAKKKIAISFAGASETPKTPPASKSDEDS